MLGGGLFIVLLALAIAVGLTALTFGGLIYGFSARDPRRGLIAAAVSLGMAVLASLLSTPVWIIVLSGKSTSGEKLDLLGSDYPFLIPVVLEALVLIAAAAALVRRLRQRRAPPPPPVR